MSYTGYNGAKNDITMKVDVTTCKHTKIEDGPQIEVRSIIQAEDHKICLG